MAIIRKSPSETLMDALADIDGARDLAIIWTRKDADGFAEVKWICNDSPLMRVIGMMEVAKHEMFDTVMRPEEWEEEDV